jgi:DNA-binding MarR family transcriptional regulator
MSRFDEIIHQPLRLKIMAALCQLQVFGEAKLNFGELKDVTGATDGNLGAHILALEKAGYVRVEKSFVGRRPNTAVHVEEAGRIAFSRHVAALNALLNPG